MFRKTVLQGSSNVASNSSRTAQSSQLWQPLAEAEQEVAKGGFGFPGFPPVGPWRPGEINKNHSSSR